MSENAKRAKKSVDEFETALDEVCREVYDRTETSESEKFYQKAIVGRMRENGFHCSAEKTIAYAQYLGGGMGYRRHPNLLVPTEDDETTKTFSVLAKTARRTDLEFQDEETGRTLAVVEFKISKNITNDAMNQLVDYMSIVGCDVGYLVQFPTWDCPPPFEYTIQPLLVNGATFPLVPPRPTHKGKPTIVSVRRRLPSPVVVCGEEEESTVGQQTE